jgi:hypothetical protein
VAVDWEGGCESYMYLSSRYQGCPEGLRNKHFPKKMRQALSVFTDWYFSGSCKGLTAEFKIFRAGCSLLHFGHKLNRHQQECSFARNKNICLFRIFFSGGARAARCIDFGAEMIAFDRTLIGRSRHLLNFQTPLAAQYLSTRSTSL